jgi:FKBP-type peptidyl-prolyl cis-trans isomerase SlyD
VEKIEPNAAVTIRYTLRIRLPDGTRNERSPETFGFVFGIERQVPTLERALDGAGVGEKLNLHVPPGEIYGVYDPALIREIPKRGLIRQRLRPGRFYRQMKKGALISFKVLEVKSDTVVADFNRPMAGISTDIDLEVLAVRQATKEEIAAAREAQLKKNIGCG